MALAAVLSAVLVFTANLQLVVLAMVGVGLLAVLYVNPAWGIILVILLQTIKRTFAVFVGMVPFLTVNRLLVIWVFFAILTQRFTTSEKLRFYSHPMNAFIALYSIWILITSILAVNYVYTVAFIPIMIGNLVLLFLLCISGLAADIGRRRSGAAVFGTKHLGEEARAGTLGVGQANSFAVLIVLLLVIIGMYAQVIGELGIPGFLLFMYMLYLAWHDLAICRRRLIQSEGILLWCLVHGMNIGWPFYLMGAFTLDMAYDKGFWFILAIPIIVRRLLQGQEQGETSRSGLIRPAA